MRKCQPAPSTNLQGRPVVPGQEKENISYFTIRLTLVPLKVYSRSTVGRCEFYTGYIICDSCYNTQVRYENGGKLLRDRYNVSLPPRTDHNLQQWDRFLAALDMRRRMNQGMLNARAFPAPVPALLRECLAGRPWAARTCPVTCRTGARRRPGGIPHLCPTTAHRPQLTSHSSQGTAHRPQLTGHSSQLTGHSSQATEHSPQLTAHSEGPARSHTCS